LELLDLDLHCIGLLVVVVDVLMVLVLEELEELVAVELVDIIQEVGVLLVRMELVVVAVLLTKEEVSLSVVMAVLV
jgi:hypothetical protein